MIGVTVNHEGNTLLMSLPTDELYDHLGSILSEYPRDSSTKWREMQFPYPLWRLWGRKFGR